MYTPIVINGYSGYAMIRTSQPISLISEHLADGLQDFSCHIDCRLAAKSSCKGDCTGPCDEDCYSAVEAPISMGAKNVSITQQFFILEDVECCVQEKWPFLYSYSDDGPPELPQVILGSEFLTRTRTSMSKGAVHSKLFGDMPIVRGLNQPFVRIQDGDSVPQPCIKDYTTTNYGKGEDYRIVLLFDLDCFEVQVHEQPWQRGKPRVVVNSSGRITAVSYEAKKLGINRESTPYLNQAKAKYKKLIEIQIPTREGIFKGGPPRPDGSHAREATARIVNAIKSVLSRYDEDHTTFEFSSGDEFFVDITKLVEHDIQERGLVSKRRTMFKDVPTASDLWPNTYLFNGTVSGQPTPEYTTIRLKRLAAKKDISPPDYQELRLLIGSIFANVIIKEILAQTDFQSSVGMASNKLVSKIASGIHKPGSVTIFAPSGFDKFSRIVEIRDIPGLGGKTGEAIIRKFNAETMHELRHVDAKNLAQCPIENGHRIGHDKAKEFLNKANGICYEPVVEASCYKTSGVNRSLYGKPYSSQDMVAILKDQCQEMFEKLEFEKRVNCRFPVQIKMTFVCTDPGIDNIHSTIDLVNCGRTHNGNELYKMFQRNSDATFWKWARPTRLDECRMAATF